MYEMLADDAILIQISFSLVRRQTVGVDCLKPAFQSHYRFLLVLLYALDRDQASGKLEERERQLGRVNQQLEQAEQMVAQFERRVAELEQLHISQNDPRSKLNVVLR